MLDGLPEWAWIIGYPIGVLLFLVIYGLTKGVQWISHRLRQS